MSTEDEVRKTREAVERLENARLRLSGDVIRGDPKALDEDRQLQRRIRDLSRWIMRAEQQAEEDERRADTEHRAEELREAWREHHPQEEEREKGRPKKDGPS